MKTLLITSAIIVVALILKACVSTGKKEHDTSRPADSMLPSVEKENDKLIFVSDITHEDVQEALREFCNMYNKNDFAAIPRLWQLSSRSYAVTFPYDVDFTTYCFAINFLRYPSNLKYKPQVMAWATTKPGDDWVTDKTVDKKVMLFVPEDDKEYDNVYLTTIDNIGYKLGFSSGNEKQLLSLPKQPYQQPGIKKDSLTGDEHEDFK